MLEHWLINVINSTKYSISGGLGKYIQDKVDKMKIEMVTWISLQREAILKSYAFAKGRPCVFNI